MNLILNDQQTDWLKKELEIMIEEVESNKEPRSQFSIITIHALLGKLNEDEEWERYYREPTQNYVYDHNHL